jgi:riboflavin kinase
MESVLQERKIDGGACSSISFINVLIHVQEIHIMHEFPADFYGYEMKALVLGYIRPELDYISRGEVQFLCINPFVSECNTPEALIEDIEIDKQVALNSLERPEYNEFMTDPHF